MTLTEKLTISNELPYFLHGKIGGIMLVRRMRNKEEDYQGFLIMNDNIKLPAVCVYLDLFYQERRFSLSELSTAVLPKFSLRTYRHLSGSSAQVMIAKEKSEFYFFISDNETDQQREIRVLLAEKLKTLIY